jgi:hypothetical protein
MNISCLRNIRLALSFFILAFSTSTIAQVIPISPLTQDGAAPAEPTLTFLWASPQAKAVLIFIPGGEGRLKLTPERKSLGGFYGGALKPLSDPTLTSALFHVVVFDSPVDLPVGTIYPVSRASADHLMRIDSVVRHYKNKFSLPIWLMGHSDGVASMVEYFKKLQDTRQENIIEGMVYSSARNGVFFRTGTRVPILFLAHEQDGCAKSTVSNSTSHYKALTGQGNTQLAYVLIRGGQAEGNPCSSGFHMFNGAYEQAYRAIDAFASPRLMPPAAPAAVKQN